MSQTDKAQVRIKNNVPRVIGLAGQLITLQPGATQTVAREVWQKALQHPLTPRLVRDKLIEVLKSDKESISVDKN